MQLKKTRQVLKSLADDTRLRIINLLDQRSLSVTELCNILEKNQSNISKHLTRLRLTGVVMDKRLGLNVYYALSKTPQKWQKTILKAITSDLSGISIFKKDILKLKKLKQQKKGR